MVIYAQTRPTSDTAWTGFPRRQSCSLSPTADETLQGNPIYVSGVPAQSVQAEEVFIEDLGDSTVRLTVTFAGTPEPVQQVLVPGHGDQRFPEPAAWGFTIELFPQGFGAKYPPPIYFHSNDDNPGWSGWQVDGLDGEARFLPVDEWGFAGRTFTLTADLSGYFGIPKGDEFSTDIWVRPLQHNAPHRIRTCGPLESLLYVPRLRLPASQRPQAAEPAADHLHEWLDRSAAAFDVYRPKLSSAVCRHGRTWLSELPRPL
ncbi:hypothetical protein MTX80_23150 (plasmid) [Gordonia amicalis]|nr:hypothetical protein [Gordonia amicalis]UOG23818.1 hypothetical protein MTX80_23150 [Gordonia amicalis]